MKPMLPKLTKLLQLQWARWKDPFEWHWLNRHTLTCFSLCPTATAIHPCIEWSMTCCWSGASTRSTCGRACCPGCPHPYSISWKYQWNWFWIVLLLAFTFVILVDVLVDVHYLRSWWIRQSSNQVGCSCFITVWRFMVVDFTVGIDWTHGCTSNRF